MLKKLNEHLYDIAEYQLELRREKIEKEGRVEMGLCRLENWKILCNSSRMMQSSRKHCMRLI